MKKIILAFFIAVLVPLQACAQETWKEGEHYTIINETATDKPVINEFFSYWCPHCFQFEPIAKKIQEKMGDDVKFEKVHVNFMGFTSGETQDDASRALMVARALKKEDSLSTAIFRYIHVQKSPITNIKDLKNIFMVNGVEEADFDKLVSSFGVNSMLKKNNKLVQEYRSHLRGVPNFIVNGKYQAKFTRDMNNDDIVNLIVWLSKQK
ncbi:MAG: disulfide bond formation protein DsbA [Alteromonadaceae bacterium]|jgi:thiol:disulfide interchange protein DsbA|uniref:Thiol:disulfide interchange protein n=2 Tax=Paraglaciecola mesophila TaxID=197222 RepID=K6ZRX6_9ALTE|nr:MULTISPECIES: thiol:disulfide interchange protein DsbA/DsbL [Paraglaciecola]ABG42077.1 DSBA oxidoreductase [Paraglaciecola sp. T6c]MAD16459.1 disulfide bond formation protein DsbA [Alteromonadaceae bacterium]MBB20748.1 disulfide bond formation protein DsbA [Rickettsiales bacterium]GAC26050.1 thiol:disulfide interchange protein DsbA [Paraglaciecola mesophila KMM 241]|tara:strand:- start:2388 stop:3011 length:624 start_codon:yes stop_codon:yes gene_type:complete